MTGNPICNTGTGGGTVLFVNMFGCQMTFNNHRVINVRRRQTKPSCGILWDQITDEMLQQMPILTKLRSCPAERALLAGLSSSASSSANPDSDGA